MFSIHLLITAALAPALGVASSSVFGAFDHGRFHPEQTLTALLGGFVALAFIWFITLPVGALTYFICLAALRRGLIRLWLWLFVWMALGGGCGFAMGQWSASLTQITSIVGAVVGGLTGLVLHRCWNHDAVRPSIKGVTGSTK